MNPKIDEFLQRTDKWRDEMTKLRRIALGCGLGEELKWRKPCYTFEGSNVAIIQPFGDQCALMFFKGSLLRDPDGLLEPPGPNSHIARRMVFSTIDDVVEMEDRLRAFIQEAIEIERAGLTVEVGESREPRPAELDEMFDEVPGLKEAFEALTPGRQRGYILHFSGAKQSSTRKSRIEKCVPKILDGR